VVSCVSGDSRGKKMPWPKVPASTVSLMDAPRAHAQNVASPHTITGLSVGTHTIYLKVINQQEQEDPTPVKWTFIVTGGSPPPKGLPDTRINWVRAKPTGPNIPYGVSM
jgi:hypothetical protein